MAKDDLNRVLGIRNDKLHRLRLLEKRQAQEGFNTPPSIILEIEQTRRELGITDEVVKNPGSFETAEAVGSAGQYLALDSKLDLVIKFFSERMDRMEENSVEWRKAQEVKHDAGARVYRLALATLTACVVFLLLRSAGLL